MKKMFLICLGSCFNFIFLYAADFPKIENFLPRGAALSYYPDNLFEYIDGAADAYLAYGFQQLVTRDFFFKDVAFTIDIYDMGSRLNAFGIYRTERPGQAESLKIGVEAVVSPPYQCLLLKGNFYVKVNAFEGEFLNENGQEILKILAGAIDGAEELPEELNLLPQKNLIDNSQGYCREAYLGLSILQRCLYADYHMNEKAIRYYVIVPTKEEPAEVIWKNLASKWSMATANKGSILYKEIPYQGYTGVTLVNDKILGIVNCQEKAQLLELLPVK